MSEIVKIIEKINWEMNKTDLNNAFSSMDSLPPHPTQNAIGFETLINGIPSAIICYFNSKLFKEKLGAINVMVYDDPPLEEELKSSFSTIKTELTTQYGEPINEKDFFVVWAIQGSVLQLEELS